MDLLLSDDKPKVYECQGIGHLAKCGRLATIPVQVYKWNAQTEQIEETTVWICQDHFEELKAVKSNRL